jgi:hypothetical protein
MISRISSIMSPRATAIPSDEGRVYSLIRKAPVQLREYPFQRDTYSDFAHDRFPKIAEPPQRDLAANSALYGFGLALFALIIRA